MKVLIVDDEKGIRDSYRMILEYEGYEVEEASSGFSALKKIKTGQYKIILLDLMLPDIKGIEILERIKEDELDVNVIVITGHGNVRDHCSDLFYALDSQGILRKHASNQF